MALFLHRRPWARGPVRVLVAWPAIVLLRAIAALTAPLRPHGLRIAVLAGALAAGALALTAGGGGGVIVARVAAIRALAGGSG